MCLFALTLVLLLQQVNPSSPATKPRVEKRSATGIAQQERHKISEAGPVISPQAGGGNLPENAPAHDPKQTNTYDPRNDLLYRCYLWSTIIGVVGGFIGIAILVIQSRILKTSADAAKDAAKVAQLSAQAVINAERPWLVISVEKREPNHFFFNVSPRGRTPAKIISNYAKFTATNYNESPPSPPNYGLETVLAYPPLVMPNDAPFPVYDFPVSAISGNNQPFWEEIISLKKQLYFLGKIVYEDVLAKNSDGTPAIHETRWCYVYYTGGFVTKGGPPEYNGYT